jgi:hypothetical protein
MNRNHELFDILDCYPNWQTRFNTLRDAADHAGALAEYYDYMLSTDGIKRRLEIESIPDTVAVNRAQRSMRERMLHRTSRANPTVSDEIDNGGESE